MLQQKNKSVNLHQFSMIPSAQIPRSSFLLEWKHKTTMDAGKLVPIYVDEVLPGDSFNLRMTIFARLATPINPIMDNLHVETFFFFVPYRIIWNNFKKMMGEQDSPGDSISYTVPQQVSPAGGYAIGSLQDHMGLPTVGQVGGAATVTHSALPLRAYNLIYQEWFRDENLQNAVTVDRGDGPDTVANYTMRNRGKRKDYFTGALPWPQKGATAVSLPLGTTATIKTNATDLVTGSQVAMYWKGANAGGTPISSMIGADATGHAIQTSTASGATIDGVYPSNLYADLSTATAATINQIRQAFQIQRLLERDARGGTRYTEKIRAHFGVVSPDARLQRPEYLGGGHTPIIVHPIAQTSGTSASGTTTPMGTLSAAATAIASGHGFTQSFTEHGVIIGMAAVRADLTYQQGLRKMWSRTTQYDFYWPVFAMLGEQAVLNKEIYCDGSANDNNVFGYQERWAEYRNHPSEITGLFRSTATGTIDNWHLAQKFTALPTLNDTFIQDTPPLSRILAVGSSANGQQLIVDTFFSAKVARPMPLYSVPGMIDHF